MSSVLGVFVVSEDEVPCEDRRSKSLDECRVGRVASKSCQSVIAVCVTRKLAITFKTD